LVLAVQHGDTDSQPERRKLSSLPRLTLNPNESRRFMTDMKAQSPEDLVGKYVSAYSSLHKNQSFCAVSSLRR